MANKTQHKIELTALDKTKKAFNSVKSGLGKITGATIGVTKVLGASALAFSGVATAVGLTTKKTLDFADALGKTSSRTGLSTDLIQALQIAFIESGASSETAEKSLAKFARTVGDAQRGLKTYTDIFNDLGVSFDDSEGNFVGIEEVFLRSVEAISQLDTVTEAATVKANLFGRAGIILTNAFEGGREGIEEFQRRLDDLGIALSGTNIKNAETFNDSLFILTKQFNSLKDNIILSFLPVLQEVVNIFQKNFKELAKNTGGFDAFGQVIAKKGIDSIANFLQGAGDLIVGIRKLGIRLEIVGLQVKNFFTNLEETYNSFVKLPFVIGLTTDQMRYIGNLFKDAAVETLEFTDEIQGLEEELENVQNPFDSIVDQLLKIKDAVGKDTEAFATLTQMITKFRKAGEEMSKGLKDMQNPLERLQSQFTDKGFANQMNQIFVKTFDDAATSLTNFVMTGKLNFRGFIDSLVADLLRLQIRKGLFNLFGIGSMTGSVPSGDGGGFTGMGARVGGIDGKGGFPAILHPNETVVDHTKGQSVGSTNINFTIQATDTSGFDQLLTSRKNQIVAMISQAMNQRGKTGLI